MKKFSRKNMPFLVLSVTCFFLVCLSMILIYDCIAIREENAQLELEQLRTERAIAKAEKTIQELSGQIQQLEDKLEKSEAQNNPESGSPEQITYLPGAILDSEQVLDNEDSYFQCFQIVEGDEIYNRINGKSYTQNDHISLENLRYLRVVHYNFEHKIQSGEIIVHAALCDDFMNIFKELFHMEYEIQSMYLVDNFWTGEADSTDSASIEQNNTSCFNYREITGGGNLSNHAYGYAVDINPQQNPYVWYVNGEACWTHENAAPYIDRNSGASHVIVQGDGCWSVFEKYGFTWGGLWTDPVDYQHFEKKIY